MFQFGHLSWAARVRTAKRSSIKVGGVTTREVGWSAQDLADEAERKAGACEHIEAPQPPNLIFGVMPSEAVVEATEWGNNAKEGGEKRKTKLRSTSPVMAAGVISLPDSLKNDVWPIYRDECVKALKDKYGERLRSVVEHLDEAHPHIHFYLVPNPGEDFGAVHEGYAASRKARKEPENKVRTAFQQAMQGWQDWLFEAVSSRFGLARTGPARERIKRQEWQRQNALTEAQAAQEAARVLLLDAQSKAAAAEKRLAELDAAKSSVEAARAELEQAKADLDGERRDIRRERRALERQKEELTAEQTARLQELEARELELKKERDLVKKERAEAKSRGFEQGLEQAGAVKASKKLGRAVSVFKDVVGIESAREKELKASLDKASERERVAREEARKLEEHVKSLKATIETLRVESERKLRDEREKNEIEKKEFLERAQHWSRRENELMNLYADADNELKALKRGRNRRFD